MRIHTRQMEGASRQEALRREGDEAVEDSERTVPTRYSTEDMILGDEIVNRLERRDEDVPIRFSEAELPPSRPCRGGSSSLAWKAVGGRREGASQECHSRALRHDLRGA